MDPVRENDWAAVPLIESHPWDPMQGEKPAAYKAFCIYRDAPPDEQTHRAVAQKRYSSATPTQVQRMGHWSSNYKWAERAKAYIQHQSEVKQAAIQAELLEESKKAAKERLDASRLIVKLVLKWVAENYKNAGDMPPGPIATLFKVGVDVSRLEEDLSTEKVDGSVIVKVLRGISMDDL